ncbi:hypothetical protein AsAng_0046340 [Aureispira anguillae]|uniref:Uncharacterized protein n=1 Tax=Aureispira anguillae TaxID=2864201 RepID=A0A916DWA7_9BACT|nr:hypothetical protein AsAng_0046340 [Aureispira anguillae]
MTRSWIKGWNFFYFFYFFFATCQLEAPFYRLPSFCIPFLGLDNSPRYAIKEVLFRNIF